MGFTLASVAIMPREWVFRGSLKAMEMESVFRGQSAFDGDACL